MLVPFLLGYLLTRCTAASRDGLPTNERLVYSAFVNITYQDPLTGEIKTEYEESGKYGRSSRIDSEQGWVVHVVSADDKNDGCDPPINVPSGRWIALIQRGSCKFKEKIQNAAVKRNASAVVIYDNKIEGSDLVAMEHDVDDVVSIFISKADGVRIIALLENRTKVWMQISVGSSKQDQLAGPINKTSVLFVSISFIVLMIISLAWLVFYYIQRFRYAHAKERLSKRLMHAAKKAIAKMPMKAIKSGDKELDADYDPCAVCIENYKSGDVVRVLPCKHIFHKTCVDPWLIESRSCPMCKLDILKAYGLQIHQSRESLVFMEYDGASTSIDPSDLMTTNNAIRDDPHIVELVYYPYNVHLRVRLPETRSEAEETITGLEPAIHNQADAVNSSELEECNESQALIPKLNSVKSSIGDGDCMKSENSINEERRQLYDCSSNSSSNDLKQDRQVQHKAIVHNQQMALITGNDEEQITNTGVSEKIDNMDGRGLTYHSINDVKDSKKCINDKHEYPIDSSNIEETNDQNESETCNSKKYSSEKEHKNEEIALKNAVTDVTEA